MRTLTVSLLSLLSLLSIGCAQVPKSYSWQVVDCSYQRGVGDLEADQVRADCKLEGRVEMRDSLFNLF